MRKLILPCLFFLLVTCIPGAVFSQFGGTTCGNAYTLALTGDMTNELCDSYPRLGDPDAGTDPDNISTGSRVYCTSEPLPNPPISFPPTIVGKVVWFKFHPTNLSSCVRVKFDVTVLGVNYPAEVAFYTTCPSTLAQETSTVVANASMCLTDGKGIWAPPADYDWAMPAQDYYLRVFVFYDGTERININACTKQYVPENDVCTDATPIPVLAQDADGVADDNVCGNSPTDERNAIYRIPSAGNTDGRAICAQTLENTTFYKFTVSSAGSATINISDVDCDTKNGAGGNYIQAGLLRLKPGRNCFDAYNSPAGSGSPWMSVNYYNGPPVQPVPPRAAGMPPSGTAACLNLPRASDGLNNQLLTTESLPAGTVVYLAIDGYDGANCNYKISARTNIEPIPVRMRFFEIWKKGGSNLVRWVTAWEQNCDYFEVQRSVDGVDFSPIGSVRGSGNSEKDINYGFDDNFPPTLAYYRLKQVDLDGKFTYSKIVMIRRDETKSYLSATFANPVYTVSKIIINTRRAGMANIQIVSSLGENINTQNVSCAVGSTTIIRDFSKLPAGTYFMVINQDGNKIVKPFIKQ